MGGLKSVLDQGEVTLGRSALAGRRSQGVDILPDSGVYVSYLSNKKPPVSSGFLGGACRARTGDPPACKAGALPTELTPRSLDFSGIAGSLDLARTGRVYGKPASVATPRCRGSYLARSSRRELGVARARGRCPDKRQVGAQPGAYVSASDFAVPVAHGAIASWALLRLTTRSSSPSVVKSWIMSLSG